MSLRRRLIQALLRFNVKPFLRFSRAPARNRGLLEGAAKRMFRAPPLSLYRPIRLSPDLPALWISNRPGTHPPRAGKVVLYFHGGGFIAGSPDTHRHMLARLSRLSRVEVCAPDYRLAPEQPFPAAPDDARAAFEAIVARGYAPGDIVLGGDSAGGNLALGLLAELCAEARRPAGCFALSPVTDMSFSGASIRENEGRDSMLPANRRADVQEWYLGPANPLDPRASPVFARFPSPPPVFLQYADTEILRDDARRMAAHLRAEGGEVIEDAWPDAPHVWPLFDGWMPEAREALRRIAGFIEARFGPER